MDPWESRGRESNRVELLGEEAKRRRGNEMPHQNPGLITVFAKRKPALSWPIEFEGLHWNVDMT